MTDAEIEAVAIAILRAAGSHLAHYTPATRRAILAATRAVIAKMDKARGGGWRTMDSAPKDGQALLAVVQGQVRLVAFSKPPHVAIMGFYIADQGPAKFNLCRPVYWRPIPAPPTTEGA